jgi:hypothetical protein
MAGQRFRKAGCRDEDTQAILARRRFLIESALAGGLGALAAGCEKEEPSPCLKVGTPRVCLKVPPPEPPKKPDTATTPQPCLSPPVEPRPCLEVAPPPKKDAKGTGEGPRVCLSVRIDDK